MASWKRDRYLQALFDGATPEQAAAAAGYTPKYGRQLAGQADIRGALERRRQYEERRAAGERAAGTPAEILEEMAYDVMLDPRVRIQAIRVLHMLALGDQEGKPAEPVTLVDDIPPVDACRDCPHWGERVSALISADEGGNG